MLRSMVASMAVALAAGLFAAGCESMGGGNGGDAKADTHAGHGAAMATTAEGGAGQAVACEKCKVTWTRQPVTGGKNRVVAYKMKKGHECPDCRAAAQNFFATGAMQHECKTCGPDALQACEAHVSQAK